MGYFAIILASLIGAINPPLLKLNLMVFSPFAVMFFRFFISIICLSIWLLITKRKLAVVSFKPLATVSILVASALLFIIIGLSKTTITNTQSILALSPVLVAVLSNYMLNETPSKNQLLGVLSGFIGVSIIINGPFTNTIGNLSVFAATICNAFYIIFSRKHKANITPFMLTVGTMVASTIIFGIALFIDLIIGIPWKLNEVSFMHISSLVFLATIGSFGMFYFLQYGISKVNALFASLGQYIQLPISIWLGVIFFNEKLSTSFVIGTLLIVFGSIFSSKLFEKKENLAVSTLPVKQG